MENSSAGMITIRVTANEKAKFHLLSKLTDKPISALVKDLIDRELKDKKYSAKELRKLPRELRNKVLLELTEDALPIYNRYKEELFVEETGDGI